MADSIMAGDIALGLGKEVLSLCLFLLTLFASGKYAKCTIFGKKDCVWDLLDSFSDAIDERLRGYIMQSYHG